MAPIQTPHSGPLSEWCTMASGQSSLIRPANLAMTSDRHALLSAKKPAAEGNQWWVPYCLSEFHISIFKGDNKAEGPAPYQTVRHSGRHLKKSEHKHTTVTDRSGVKSNCVVVVPTHIYIYIFISFLWNFNNFDMCGDKLEAGILLSSVVVAVAPPMILVLVVCMCRCGCVRVCMLSWPTHLLFPLLLSCDLHNTNTRRNNKSFLDLLTHFWRGAIKIFLLQMQILTPCIEGWRLVLYSSADLSALGVFLLSFCCAANSELGWGLLGTP